MRGRVLIERLEDRVMLSADADPTGSSVYPPAITQALRASAAVAEPTVATQVVLKFKHRERDALDGTLVAFVTAAGDSTGAEPLIVDRGWVTFYRGGESLGPAVPVRDGMATLAVPQQVPGVYQFQASYEGQDIFRSAPPTTTIVDLRGPVRLTLGNVPAARKGQPVALRARVWNGRDDRATVTFYDDKGRLIGSAPVVGHAATISLSLPLGEHTITARYAGDGSGREATSTQTLTVHHRKLVDLLVAYTPAAEASLGGAAKVQAAIARAVDDVNYVLRNSRVRVSIRLVGTVRVEYDETRNYERDVVRLEGETDGHMDAVHAARFDQRADLVSLFVGSKGKGNTIGTAYRMMKRNAPDNDSRAFSVVHAKSAAGPSHVLAHELAHNFGAAHDNDNGSSEPVVAPYAHGFKGFIDGEQVRDVMGQPPGRTLPYFSNPRIKHGGERLGDERTADVARLIEETATIVANYREEKVGWGLWWV